MGTMPDLEWGEGRTQIWEEKIKRDRRREGKKKWRKEEELNETRVPWLSMTNLGHLGLHI